MKYFIPLFVVMFLGAGCSQTVQQSTVRNFEECVAAGNAVMESYPRQCRSGEKTFVEEVDINRICADQCGNGVCEEIVCLGEGCPCSESATSCPQDCGV